MRDLFQGEQENIDFRLDARREYETRVVSKNRVLDIGGRNSASKSRQRINSLNTNPNNTIVSTDIITDYKPDIVDDICKTTIPHHSYDGIYCDAILEHVKEYWVAIDNMYNILTEEGEAFIYVPFMFAFHDLMDYHRFTFTEVIRMLDKFSSVKLFIPSEASSGFGYVLWYVVSMSKIEKFPKVHRFLAKSTNAVMSWMLSLAYFIKGRSIREKYNNISVEQFCFYYIHLFMNHGFCAWVKK